MLMFIMFSVSLYFNIILDITTLILHTVAAISLGSLFKIKGNYKIIEKYLFHYALGLGILSIFTWTVTQITSDSKHTIFLPLLILILFVRRNFLKHTFRNFNRITNKITTQNPVYICIIVAFAFVYIIRAIQPISSYDSLTKHIVIPLAMLRDSYYDYNVIKSVVFGDYALLSHVNYYLFIALKAYKAPVIFNTLIAFFSLFSLLSIARRFKLKNRYYNLFTTILLSTPIIMYFSTILYVDIVYQIFVFLAVLATLNLKSDNLLSGLPIIAFLFGLALFTKAQAFFVLFPLGLIILYHISKAFLNDETPNKSILWCLFLASSLFMISFAPSLFLAWSKTGSPFFPFMNTIFKSPYYPEGNFIDPFYKNILTMSYESIKNLVFNTSRNTEFSSGGYGYFLLAFPVIFIGVFLTKQKKYYILLTLILVISFKASLLMSYNSRYMMSSIILSSLLIVISTSYSIERIHLRYIRVTAFSLLAILLIIPNIYLITSPKTALINKAMLAPNQIFIFNSNASILSSINKVETNLLAVDDVFIGDFKGNYSTFTWMHDFVFRKLFDHHVTLDQFLSSYDYVLFTKRKVHGVNMMFDEDNETFNSRFKKHKETNTHTLYKAISSTRKTQHSKENIVLADTFKTAQIINIKNPSAFRFGLHKTEYSITLDLEPEDKSIETIARFQINWLDESGKLINAYLMPFKLEVNRKTYTSKIIEPPTEAIMGILYLVSHNSNYIKFYGYSLKASTINNKTLNDYINDYPDSFSFIRLLKNINKIRH